MKDDAEILKLALERFREIEDYEGEQRREMRQDKLFGLGEQWDKDDKASREADGRFCLTIQRSNQFTNHIKNQNRQMANGIKISPTDEGAQEKVAERRQGLIRNIQYDSKSVMARNQAFDDAVDMGRGHYIVKTDWVSPDSMDKKIVVEPIQDPFSVYMDINREKPDYSDAKFGFIIRTQRRSEFQDEYPDSVTANWTGTSNHKWTTKDRVTWAEYYCMKPKKRKLIVVESEGEFRTLYKDELKRELKSNETIVRERDVDDAEWYWYKITSEEILDREKLPFKEIPIITTIGRETAVDGKLIIKGLLRDIRDPLTLYNYVASQEAELIAMSPRAPWVMAEGQDEGYEELWANANRENNSALIYKPTTYEGQLVPPPQRNQFAGAPTGLINQRHEIIDDCMNITGIHESSLGMKSNETSGIAIRRRQAQGENSNFHYTQNGVFAVNHEGRVINSALNIVYDTQRTITIMGEDDEQEMMEINGQDDPGLGEGNFQVTVSTGPSTNTAREEQASGMLELISAVPLVQNVASDLVVRTQDWRYKDALADRLEYAIEKQVPGITTQVKPDGENQEMIVLQQQLQQAQGQMQEMGQQAQQLQQALEKAQADKQAAAAGKVQIDMEKLKLDWEKFKAEKQRLEAELQLKAKELELKGQTTDLELSAKVEIEKEKNQVELIKVTSMTQREREAQAANLKIEQQKANVSVFDAVTKRMSAEQSAIDSKESKKLEKTVKEEKPAKPDKPGKPTTVNVYPSKKKQSIVTAPDGKKYTIETKEDA